MEAQRVKPAFAPLVEQQHLHNEFITVAVGVLLGALSIELCLVLGSHLPRKQPRTTPFTSTESAQQVFLGLTICSIIFSTVNFLAGVLRAHSLPSWVSDTSCLLFESKFLDSNSSLKVVAVSAVYLLAKWLTSILWRFTSTKVINCPHTLRSTSSDQSRKEQRQRWKRSLDLVFKHLVWIPVVPPC